MPSRLIAVTAHSLTLARATRQRARETRQRASLERQISERWRVRTMSARVWARAASAARQHAIVIAGGADGTVRRNQGRPCVVLVVDDHEDTRQMYAQFLDAMGFRALEATTCAEVVDRTSKGDIDAVVLDRRLPDGDGAEVCGKLKTDPRTRHIPIVVLSGRAQDASLDADAYLLKPVVPDDLLRELERLLARRDGVAR